MDQLLTLQNAVKSRLSGRKTRILVAPLDWGLGHATRCIPIVRELLAQGADVWLAGEGAQEELLKAEFPALPFLALAGYRIRYAKSAGGLLWKMIQQGPKLHGAIRAEQQWLNEVVAAHGIDAVISDNRYGLYHTAVPCVFITHQLLIKSAAGKWTEKMLQKRNYRYISRFTDCWVPDRAGDENLAGELSHPALLPAIPVKYIGHLSRFSKIAIPEKKDHLLVVLSGPEPQRSQLEDMIVEEISHYNGTATVLRGLPGMKSLIPSTGMIQFHNHLTSGELNTEMQEAAFIISRSGYSTVMDVMALQKKSILIPTPGQTEQEYLGRYLMKKELACSVPQKRFSLPAAIAAAKQFNYQLPPAGGEDLLAKAVSDLLAQVAAPALG